jgi:hypothetical protein
MRGIWDWFDSKDKENGRLDPTVLPGFAYSRALARKMDEKEGEEESERALREAMKTWPEVVPLLAGAMDVVLPADVAGRTEYRIRTDGQCVFLFSLYKWMFVEKIMGVGA